MQTIQTTVYTYSELDEEAKEKARNWYRHVLQGDTFGAEGVIDDATAGLKFTGWNVDEIYYSGFYSQGDGACFKGTWRADRVDVAKLKDYAPETPVNDICAALAAVATRFPRAVGSVKQKGHYQHENCTEFQFDAGDDEDEDIQNIVYRSPEDVAHGALVDSAEDDFIEASKDAMRWIYTRLEQDYEYRNSDENVAENIDANEYTFTADGKRFG